MLPCGLKEGMKSAVPVQVPRITLAGPSTREAEARGNGFSPEKLQSCLADIDCPDQVQNSQDLGFSALLPWLFVCVGVFGTALLAIWIQHLDTGVACLAEAGSSMSPGSATCAWPWDVVGCSYVFWDLGSTGNFWAMFRQWWITDSMSPWNGHFHPLLSVRFCH